mgnify:FL=1
MESSRLRILLTRKWPKKVEEYLGDHFDVQLNEQDLPMTAVELRAALQDFDVLCPTVTDLLGEEVFGVSPIRTKLIANFGVGYNHIALDSAEQAGIQITNTPGVLTDATAEIAMMLILMSARRAGEGERHLRAGQWSGWRPTHMLSTQVTGKTLGIIGMGRIGTRLARQAHHGFGMQIIYGNRSRAAESVEVELGAEYCSVEEVFERSDFLSLNCPANQETKHLANEQMIRRMKPSAHLINTARGDVVDESALSAALSNREIAGAGLDVYENEPEVTGSLASLEQVVLLPHMGSGTVETREAMGFRAVANIEAFAERSVLPDLVVIH